MSLLALGAAQAAPASAVPEAARAIEGRAALAAPQGVVTRTFDWTDASRGRVVPVRLYLPAHASSTMQGSAAPLPLVMFSHGLGGSRDGYSYIGRHLAGQGYASLHVQHVGSDREVWRGSPFGLVSRLTEATQPAEALARVQDLKFALDTVLAMEARGELGVNLDHQRIAAAGHSYGANTALLASGAQVEFEGKAVSLRDPRIRAAILISAPPFFGSDSVQRILSGLEIPTLHVTATGDDIRLPGYTSGVSDRIDLYRATSRDKGAPKALVVFRDGSHSMFTDRAGTGGVTLNPRVKLATQEAASAFLGSVFGSDTAALERWQGTHAALLAGFERSLPQ